MKNKFELFKPLIETSRNEKRGITFYIGGQTVIGIVTNVIGTEAVELQSRMFTKAIIHIEAVDAAALG